MTYAPLTHGANRSLWLGVSENVYHLMQRFEDYRDYRRTVKELSCLNSAQLSDLGLHYSEIKRAANDAVYGPRA